MAFKVGQSLRVGFMGLADLLRRRLTWAWKGLLGDGAIYAALENLGIGYAVVDARGYVKTANQCYAEFAGFRTPCEVEGRHCHEWLSPELRGHFQQLLHSGRGIGRARRTRHVLPDGTSRTLEVDWWKRTSVDGPEHVFFCRDITNELAAQAALRLRNRVFDATPNGVVLFSRENDELRIAYLNSAFEELSGTTRNQLLGLTPQALQKGLGESDELRQLLNRSIAGGPARGTVTACGSDGRKVRYAVAISAMPAEHDGESEHLLAVFSDVTQVVELTEINRLRERAIAAAQNGIAIIDRRAEGSPVVFSNAAFRRMVNFSDTSAGASGLWQRVMKGADARRLLKAIEDGQSTSLQLQTHRENAPAAWLDVFVDPVKDDDGQLSYCIVMLDDVTQRRGSELRLAQIQKMDAIGQLTGGVAHDFNNLLTVIIGNAQMVLETDAASSATRERVGLALQAARRGADLTQRLLAYARRQTLNTDTLNPNGLIQELEPLMARTLGEPVKLTTKLADDLWNCNIDRGQLENAILNLAINARDAMPSGGDLIISTENRDSAPLGTSSIPGGFVLITVADTGAGMSPEVRDRAFEPFFTTKEVGKGTGLGLSTVYGFIKQSGGYIHLYSEPGKGTVVKLYLPRDESVAPQTVANCVQEPTTMFGDETVLVVEDDPHVRSTAVTILRQNGYRTIETQNAIEALHLLRIRNDVQVVFSDVVMPGGVSGIDFAARAAELHPGLPVLLASGYPREALRGERISEQTPAILAKPYTPRDLLVAIKKTLDDTYPPVAHAA